MLLGKISTVDSSVGSRAGAQELIVHDEFLGLLYRLDHTDVVQAGKSLYKDSVVAKAKSNPLKQTGFSGTILNLRNTSGIEGEYWHFPLTGTILSRSSLFCRLQKVRVLYGYPDVRWF